MSAIEIRLFNLEHHQHLILAILNLHIECIQSDDALLRYHPPFTDSKRAQMLQFWRERMDQVSRGLRASFMAIDTAQLSNCASQSCGLREENICGLVELGMPETDTGPFRGDVEMLMVSPTYRRKGIARQLMAELEKLAREKKRTLLQLSTVAGSPAAKFVYPSLGYIKFGLVPDYGITPQSKALVAGEYLYKHSI